jgi:Transposase DNA-binding
MDATLFSTPDAPTSVPLLSFGEENFGKAKLRNKARTRRLVQLADQILVHPSGTLPDKLADPNDLQACYRLLHQPAVTHAAVLAPHQALTRQRMAQADGPVLLIQDATELDYTGLLSVTDLGQLGSGRKRGLLAHHCLAVQAKDRRVLGLLNQILYRRPRVPKNESREEKRARADRESRLWQQTGEAVGPAPAGQIHIDVGDRGSDIFEYLEFELRTGRLCVVRATHDRVVTVNDPATLEVLGRTEAYEGRLFDLARSLPEWGRKEVEVKPRPGQSARSAVVRMAAAPLLLHAPKKARGEHGDEPLAMWVVYVGEIDPPAGHEPIEWVLLTNVPVHTVAEMLAVVGYYENRWLIEEFHKSQKTGCGIEQLQLGKVNHDERGRPPPKNRLEPAIALLSVVAVQLLILRQQGRDETMAAQPATEVVLPEEEQVLRGWRYGPGHAPLTVGEFFLALARLGGHLNRKSDGAPGWITLWRGWEKLQLMVLGARSAEAGATAEDGHRHEDPDSS